MSVLTVFGKNLKTLTAMRGSQTSVAEELDIGRVQFQRYLRSESFPKPHLLKRICDYFGVDARILTDPLTPAQLDLLAKGQKLTQIPDRIAPGMQEAISFTCPDQDYFAPSKEFPDGIYQSWRGAKSRLDCAYVTLTQIKTLNTGRVLRGYDYRGLYDRGAQRSNGRQREYRGILLRIQAGYAVVYFHSEPSRAITMNYLAPFELSYRPAAVGITCLARSELPNHARITRLLMIRVADTCHARLKAARESGFVPWAEVPPMVLPLIAPQGETF